MQPARQTQAPELTYPVRPARKKHGSTVFSYGIGVQHQPASLKHKSA
jgi:hypothetical protein